MRTVYRVVFADTDAMIFGWQLIAFCVFVFTCGIAAVVFLNDFVLIKLIVKQFD